MKKIYAFLLTAVCLNACTKHLLRQGTENVKSITNIPLRPSTTQVDLYFKDELPAKPFYKVQMIEALGYNEMSYEDLLKQLKANAAAAGLDGVVVIDKTQEVAYKDLLEFNTNTADLALFTNRQVAASYQKISGIGLKYKDNINYLDSIPKALHAQWWNGTAWVNYTIHFDFYGNVTNTDTVAQWYNKEIAAFEIQHHLKHRIAGWEYLNSTENLPMNFRYKQGEITLINARYDISSNHLVKVVNYRFYNPLTDKTTKYQLSSVMDDWHHVKEFMLLKKNKTIWTSTNLYNGNKHTGFYRINNLGSQPDTLLKASYEFYTTSDLPTALLPNGK
jgi:hypothetical protein